MKEQVCPYCGQEWTPSHPEEVCPKCLLLLATTETETFDQELVNSDDFISLGDRTIGPAKLRVGQTFGGYRILSLLGVGGMGEVYEAEELESGRRLALKVLAHKMETPEAQSRFIREGRMAASISHPNSVYIYGTEKIGSRMVITMELLQGGTLKDLVKKEGPLSTRRAVDVMLQIIDGLEAASQRGVLHRDVKPSNCFIDGDVVKVGDYGLSLSTLAHGNTRMTETGLFMGTPAFSSPEQLRGDDLDLRSDLYAVGAILHYLLVGKPPFDEPNFVRLMARVLEEPAPNLSSVRSDVPQGLAKIIARSLSKSPDQRYRTYEEFRTALQPYGSPAATPAKLPRRFLAGAIDCSLVYLVTMVAIGAIAGRPLGFDSVSWVANVATAVATILYFAILEGKSGASLGKRLLRLRVATDSNPYEPPGFYNSAIRTIMLYGVPSLPTYLAMAVAPELFDSRTSNTETALGFILAANTLLWALLFSTVRSHNGLAAVYDLLTRTRVLHFPAARPTRSATKTVNDLPIGEDGPIIGPYKVLGEMTRESCGTTTLLGFDMKLYRRVWIRQYADSNVPAIDAAKRHVSRFGRVRWLNGRRSDQMGESWDAYEAPTGTSFLDAATTPMPWSATRHILVDVCEEMAAAETDGSYPESVGLDRLWITADGRAKLMDFSASGTSESPIFPVKGDEVRVTQTLLQRIASAALTGKSSKDSGTVPPACPMPIRARQFLNDLTHIKNISELLRLTRKQLMLPATITRSKKLFYVAVMTAPISLPVFLMSSMIALGASEFARFPHAGNLFNALLLIEAFDEELADSEISDEDRQTLEELKGASEIYAISEARKMQARRGSEIPEDKVSSLFSEEISKNEAYLQSLLTKHADATTNEIEEATAYLDSVTEQSLTTEDPLLRCLHMLGIPFDSPLKFYSIMARIMTIWAILSLLIPGLLISLFYRNTLAMKICGLAVVNRRGERSGRLRLIGRMLIIWGLPLTAFITISLDAKILSLGIIGIFIACSCHAICSRKRSLVDRICGTWLVPS